MKYYVILQNIISSKFVYMLYFKHYLKYEYKINMIINCIVATIIDVFHSKIQLLFKIEL